MRKLIFIMLLPLLGFGQLPSSGELGMREIGTEFGYGLVPLSLRTLGTEIGINSGPISISDFYGEGGGCSSPDLITGTLKYHVSSSNCADHVSILPARYGGTTFANAGGIYTDTVCTPAASGYYSNGSIWKYWNSTTLTFTSNGLCI